VKTEIFFGKSEKQLDTSFDKQPDGQITCVVQPQAARANEANRELIYNCGALAPRNRSTNQNAKIAM
jgi:hypothetical protein